MSVIAANVDDMAGEAYGYLLERLLEEGALDVGLIPMTVKKSRPAIQVEVVARVQDEQRLARLLLCESTTLGVRMVRMRRMTLERRMVTVDTPYGSIQVKEATQLGRAMPEYEQVRALARQAQVPFHTVYFAALRAYGEAAQD